MKKKLILFISIITLFLISIILVFSARKTTYTLYLPKVDDLKNILISKESKTTEIIDIVEMEDIIYMLNDSPLGRSTTKESTNDTPTNIKSPIKLEFKFKENIKTSDGSVIYIYENKNRYFFEQPYNGIYEVSGDAYNSIFKYIR